MKNQRLLKVSVVELKQYYSFFQICRFGIFLLLTGLISACGGGGGGSDDTTPSVNDTTKNTNLPVEITYRKPGDYASIQHCLPFEGSETAALKIMFINHKQATDFDAIVDNVVQTQFKTIVPFNEFYSDMAFYQLALDDQEDYNCNPFSTTFSCDTDKIDQAILKQCHVDDINGIVKIFLTPEFGGGLAAESIFIGGLRPSLPNDIEDSAKLIIHEIGHNLGLADLYGGGYDATGMPIWGWPASHATPNGYFNIDQPGCPKWCNGFKPVTEYTQSPSAACHTFTTKEDCLAFNNNSTEGCKDVDGDSGYDCCAWSDDKPFDYFNSQCAPVWGSENIGLNCAVGTGCYAGAAHGITNWRPVNLQSESIMFNSSTSEAFDKVSENALRQVMTCCASAQDSDDECITFRKKFSDFMARIGTKKRIGSCAVVPTDS